MCAGITFIKIIIESLGKNQCMVVFVKEVHSALNQSNPIPGVPKEKTKSQVLITADGH